MKAKRPHNSIALRFIMISDDSWTLLSYWDPYEVHRTIFPKGKQVDISN